MLPGDEGDTRGVLDSTPMLGIIAGAFALAGFVKGVIGMGVPTVSIALLGLVMAPAQAASILLVPSLVTNLWQCANGGAFRVLLLRLWPMLLGICLGTLLGAVYLPSGNSAAATHWLGVALAIYAALGLSKVQFSVRPRAEGWLGSIIGAVTGAVTAATGVLAIPAVPYIQALHLDRNKLVQALGLSFTTSTVTLAAALAHAGDLHAGLVLPSAIALAAALIGMAVGQVVRERIKPQTFRLCFLLGLLALGLNLALHDLL